MHLGFVLKTTVGGGGKRAKGREETGAAMHWSLLELGDGPIRAHLATFVYV